MMHERKFNYKYSVYDINKIDTKWALFSALSLITLSFIFSYFILLWNKMGLFLTKEELEAAKKDLRLEAEVKAEEVEMVEKLIKVIDDWEKQLKVNKKKQNFFFLVPHVNVFLPLQMIKNLPCR